MNKKLLVDVRPFEISRQKIDESIKENDGRLIVKGVLQRAESKNQNGRVYPREVLMKETTKYLDEQVSERRALGELDHPDSSVVNLNNVSHNILEMHWKGDDLIGMSKTIGLSIIELSNIIRKKKPDLVVAIADRYENLSVAIAASYMNIPVAHIQGGETTGSIDEKVRHAVTKLSTYNFESNKLAYERVIKMGETIT